jgi:hypothetical protein
VHGRNKKLNIPACRQAGKIKNIEINFASQNKFPRFFNQGLTRRFRRENQIF